MTFTIWKAALLLGLLAFSALLWLNSHVGYEAKSAILIKGNGENQDEVLAETIAAFAETNTFAERTLKSTRLQESAVGQLLPEEQEALIEEVSVRGGGKKGGLIIVTAENLDADTAEVASNESTETLVRMGRVYLGDEKEFTSTVIDTAILKKGLVYPGQYVAKTVLTTLFLFALLVLVEPVIGWIQRMVPGKTRTQEMLITDMQVAPDQRFVPQKLDSTFLYPETMEPVIPAPQPKASEVVNAEVFGKSETETGIPTNKTALQSVSVSMEDLPFRFETPVEEVTPETEHKEMEMNADENTAPTVVEALPAEKEPTVLEYKRRLNELLSQK